MSKVANYGLIILTMGGKSYPWKNNGKYKELMVKNTIVHGKNVNARFKMENAECM